MILGNFCSLYLEQLA